MILRCSGLALPKKINVHACELRFTNSFPASKLTTLAIGHLGNHETTLYLHWILLMNTMRLHNMLADTRCPQRNRTEKSYGNNHAHSFVCITNQDEPGHHPNVLPKQTDSEPRRDLNLWLIRDMDITRHKCRETINRTPQGSICWGSSWGISYY